MQHHSDIGERSLVRSVFTLRRPGYPDQLLTGQQYCCRSGCVPGIPDVVVRGGRVTETRAKTVIAELLFFARRKIATGPNGGDRFWRSYT